MAQAEIVAREKVVVRDGEPRLRVARVRERAASRVIAADQSSERRVRALARLASRTVVRHVNIEEIKLVAVLTVPG